MKEEMEGEERERKEKSKKGEREKREEKRKEKPACHKRALFPSRLGLLSASRSLTQQSAEVYRGGNANTEAE